MRWVRFYNVNNTTSSASFLGTCLACGLGHRMALALSMPFTTILPFHYPRGKGREEQGLACGLMFAARIVFVLIDV